MHKQARGELTTMETALGGLGLLVNSIIHSCDRSRTLKVTGEA
jgi:hypothetical protein